MFLFPPDIYFDLEKDEWPWLPSYNQEESLSIIGGRENFFEDVWGSTWNEGVIILTVAYGDTHHTLAGWIDIIPKMKQLVSQFEIYKKQNRIKPKSEKEREFFYLMLAVYGDFLKKESHGMKHGYTMGNCFSSNLDIEGIGFSCIGDEKRRFFNMIDEAFRKRDFNLLSKFSQFYKYAEEIANSEFLENIIYSRKINIEYLRSLLPKNSIQFQRLESIIKEYMINHGFVNLPKAKDIIELWRKKYPPLKKIDKLKGSWSDDNKDSTVLSEKGGGAVSKIHDILDRWGFLWLVRETEK